MNLRWLSFADPARPSGEQFLGVCIVEAADDISAIIIAHHRGINPGGEVSIQVIKPEDVAALSFSLDPYTNRLLDLAAATSLVERFQADLAQ